MVLSTAEQAQRKSAGDGIRDLVSWAAATPADAIPDHVVRRAALVLADNIAATAAAESEPEVRKAQALFADRATAHEATIFNRLRARVDRYAAAAANGTAATWCELDEGYRLAPCHAVWA